MKPLSFLSGLCLLGVLAALPAAEDKKPYPAFGKIERLDPAFDKLIAPDAIVENLADGFDWADAGIGASAVIGLGLVGAAAGLAARTQRRRVGTA